MVDGPVSVYVSMPLTGPRGPEGRDAADGARLALGEAGGRAGDLEVRAEYLDDARGRPWDPAAVGENARRAVQDSTTTAYIGELDSQPTRASLPITNQAGIAQVSPGAGGVDLTRPAESYPDSPDRYRPSGDPSFARVIPDDASQAAAVATLARELGLERVALAPVQTPAGELANTEFERAAAEVGLEVVDALGNAPAAFVPGVDGRMRLEAERDHVVTSALDARRLPPGDFPARFAARFDREPGPYAAYGFEAMSLALGAIERAEDSDEEFRGSVVDAVLDAERPDSILGRYSITEDGDTTLCAIQPYTLDAGDPVPGKPLCGGLSG